MPISNIEKLYTIQEIMNLTGYSRATIYRYIDAGKVPVIKISRQLRIRESDLQKMLYEHTERRGTLKRNWRVIERRA